MKKYLLPAFCVALSLAGVSRANAQIAEYAAPYRYARGQDVSPTYEGWERNSDGTYTMHFGYFNRNSEEDFDIPVGPDNTFDFDTADQGQPTHFYTGRRWWVFKVVVPEDWPAEKRLVWTLTTHGVTNQAKGWLQAEWEVDKGVIARNTRRDPLPHAGARW